jgi:hypothetical protein
MEMARNSALTMIRRNNRWLKIDSMAGEKLMTKAEISDIIMNEIEKTV